MRPACSKISLLCVRTCRACSTRAIGKTAICCSSRRWKAGPDRRNCPACTWSFSKGWPPSGAWTSPGSREVKKNGNNQEKKRRGGGGGGGGEGERKRDSVE